MKRSALWIAAYALAWRVRSRVRYSVDDEGKMERHVLTDAEVGAMCGADADACEAAHAAAYPVAMTAPSGAEKETA